MKTKHFWINCELVDKYLFKVRKITFEQCSNKTCLNVILMTLDRYFSLEFFYKTCQEEKFA